PTHDSPPFPYTTLFRSDRGRAADCSSRDECLVPVDLHVGPQAHAMVGAEKFPREIHDDGLALARWEAHIGDPAPAALRVLHLEIGEDDARLPSLGEGQVDARVGREDPPVEKE